MVVLTFENGFDHYNVDEGKSLMLTQLMNVVRELQEQDAKQQLHNEEQRQKFVVREYELKHLEIYECGW